MCELMVNPRASIMVFQSVLFWGARIGVTPVPPGPNKHTWSEASEAEAVNAVVSWSKCCTRISRSSSTYTVAKKGSNIPPRGAL